jgi:hypothetical protein
MAGETVHACSDTTIFTCDALQVNPRTQHIIKNFSHQNNKKTLKKLIYFKKTKIFGSTAGRPTAFPCYRENPRVGLVLTETEERR